MFFVTNSAFYMKIGKKCMCIFPGNCCKREKYCSKIYRFYVIRELNIFVLNGKENKKRNST
jgi:hypothetical protein